MKRLLILACFAIIAALPATAQEFPLTIEHKFGTSVIPEKPERVASIDFNGADNLLAFGIQPVAIRYWYGDYSRAVWPWAEPLLEGTPEILKGDLNFEQIAKTEPDVIIALWSAITEEEYEQLSKIAPVVAVPRGVGDYALPWDQLALIAGRATGTEAQAEALVADVRTDLAEVAERHPDWAGRTASVATYWSDSFGVYTAEDIRPLLLSSLGFQTPNAINDLTKEGTFWIELSEESIEVIEADVVIWFTDDGAEALDGLTLRPALQAYQESREVVADDLLASAFSHGSVISLPYAIERLEPLINAAIKNGTPAQN